MNIWSRSAEVKSMSGRHAMGGPDRFPAARRAAPGRQAPGGPPQGRARSVLPASGGNPALRLGITGIVACAVALAGIAAAMVAARQVSPHPAQLAAGAGAV